MNTITLGDGNNDTVLSDMIALRFIVRHLFRQSAQANGMQQR